MPESDRYWKGYLAFSSLALIGALIYLLAKFVPPLLGDWPSLAWTPQHLTFKPLIDMAPLVLFALAIRAEGLRARQREQRRSLAMRGDSSAMPPARMAGAPASTLDVSPVPLQGTWQGDGSPSRRTRGHLTLVILLPICLTFALPIAVAVARRPSSSPMWLVAIIGAMVVTAALWVVAIMRLARRMRRRPVSVAIATPEGLAGRSGGPSTLIRWDDARLLEVTAHRSRGGLRRAFTLYGTAARITWFERLPSTAKPADGTSADANAALKTLRHVVERTGLVPRTLAPDLMAEAPFTGERARSVRGMTGPVVVVAICVGTALLSIALPLTDIPPINLYVGGSFALLTLYAVGNGTRSLVRRSARDGSSPAHEAFTALPPAPTGDSGFTYRQPLLPWLGSLLIGFALAFDLAGVVAGVGMSFHADAVSNQIRGGLMGVILLAGIFGLAHIVSVLRRRTFTLLATDDALTMRFSSTTLTVPWDDVTSVVPETDDSGVTYTVSPGEESRAIEWSTRWNRSLHPLLGVQITDASQLAAIACQRSGKPLRIEEA